MYYKEIDKKHVEAKLYGNIGTWYASGDSFSEMLEMAESRKYEKLTIRMHCFGGSVFEGNAMYNAMQRSKLDITIIIDGVAASMACFILPAIENVFIADNAFGMLHRPSGYEAGDAAAHLAVAKLLQDMEANFIKRLTERTGMSEDEIKAKWFDGKDHWLNAEEMVQYGLAKKIVPATAKSIKDLNKDTLAGMSIENLYDRYAACLDVENNNNKNDKKMNKELLIATFQLEGLTAESTDAAVVAALQAKFKALTDAMAAMKAEAGAKRDAAIKAMLDKAKAAGKIVATATQTVDQLSAMYESIGKTSGPEVLSTILDGIASPQSIADQLVPGAKGDAAAPKTFDEVVEKGEAFIAQFKMENPAEYKRLYKAEFGHDPVTA